MLLVGYEVDNKVGVYELVQAAPDSGSTWSLPLAALGLLGIGYLRRKCVG